MFTLIEMYNEADFTNHHGFMRNVIYHNNFTENQLEKLEAAKAD